MAVPESSTAVDLIRTEPPEIAGLTIDEPVVRTHRWARNLELWIPAGILIFIVAACYLGPLIGPVPKPINGNILDANLPVFSKGHIFGTDPVGNDVFSRILYGGRVSIEVSLGTNILGLSVGGFLGMLAGYRGGKIDAVIMRCLDVLIAFPSLVLILVIAESLGPGLLNVIWALAFFSVPAFGRISRAATLRLKQSTFVLAARLSGTKDVRMFVKHLAPSVVPQLITFSFLGIGVIILLEAALSFLGLGIRPPNPSWGNMISDGQSYLSSNPSLVLIPSAFLFVTVVCVNLVGDALRARWGSL